MSSQFDYLLKFILIGDSSVGKSNIFSVYRDGTFSEKLQPSIGVEFIAKNITINDTIFRIQVWDTAGQENFVSMTKVYYRNSSVAFIIYDITEKESFHHIEFWLNELKKEAPESILLVLIGKSAAYCTIKGKQFQCAYFLRKPTTHGELLVACHVIISNVFHFVAKGVRSFT